MTEAKKKSGAASGGKAGGAAGKKPAASGGKAAGKKAPAAKASARKDSTKKTPAGKAPAKKTPAAKTPAGKAAASKPPAKKDSAKKTLAGKGAATKAPAAKAAISRSAVPKVSAAKTSAKKTSAKQPAAGKRPATKTAAPKSRAKAASVKKAVAAKPAVKAAKAREMAPGTAKAAATSAATVSASARPRAAAAAKSSTARSALPARVFITGASGFIGRALMQRFSALGVAVRGVDLQADAARSVVAGNVAAAGDWQRHAAGCELVIHAAAVVSNAAPAQLYRDVSLGSVRHALDAAIAGGATRFVQVSSIAAYGLDFDTPRDERAPVALLSGYSYCDAKAASEHPALAAHAAGEIACTIVRPGDVYGPGSRPWVLLPLEMMRKNQFLLPAGGEGVFSPVYIDNLVDGIVAAATRAEGVGQIFNLTDGQGVSCREFFGYHHRWLGRGGDPLIVPTLAARAIIGVGDLVLNRLLRQHTEISRGSLAMLMRRHTYSIAKAEALLGYAPAVGLAEGMEATGAWLRAQGLIGR